MHKIAEMLRKIKPSRSALFAGGKFGRKSMLRVIIATPVIISKITPSQAN